MRFLCDEMLEGLARWLRAAGYDAQKAPRRSRDRDLVRHALTENRILLSRDRDILQIKGAETCVHLLASPDLEGWASELRNSLKLDWLHGPMSRCLVCNVPLQDATADDIQSMPIDSQVRPGPFHTCPQCHRHYWPGSHVRRMMERLQAFASGQSGAKEP